MCCEGGILYFKLPCIIVQMEPVGPERAAMCILFRVKRKSPAFLKKTSPFPHFISSFITHGSVN